MRRVPCRAVPCLAVGGFLPGPCVGRGGGSIHILRNYAAFGSVFSGSPLVDTFAPQRRSGPDGDGGIGVPLASRSAHRAD